MRGMNPKLAPALLGAVESERRSVWDGLLDRTFSRVRPQRSREVDRSIRQNLPTSSLPRRYRLDGERFSVERFIIGIIRFSPVDSWPMQMDRARSHGSGSRTLSIIGRVIFNANSPGLSLNGLWSRKGPANGPAPGESNETNPTGTLRLAGIPAPD